MRRVTWAPQAIEDLEAIRTYVARDFTEYGNLVVNQIVAAVSRLETHSLSGRVVPEFGQRSLREVIHGPYRIVYRLKRDVVEILTVFHGARAFRID